MGTIHISVSSIIICAGADRQVLTNLSIDGMALQINQMSVQYTDQEMIPARNAMNVVTLAEVMFVTIQRENIPPSKITD
jgi:hypothetical protein